MWFMTTYLTIELFLVIGGTPQSTFSRSQHSVLGILHDVPATSRVLRSLSCSPHSLIILLWTNTPKGAVLHATLQRSACVTPKQLCYRAWHVA